MPDLAEKDVSLFGGVPLVCHGLTLMLKPSSNVGGSPIRLQIDRKHLLSPLGRTDALQYLMEECNYMAHSWSRPSHHPWYLGPRCLRVLSPRPHMEVTNLTDSVTDGKAIEGTVNRILFELSANENYNCRDIILRVRCTSHVDRGNPSLVDAEGEPDEPESDSRSLFVQPSDAAVVAKTTEGINLPRGWEPRRDIITDESHDASSTVMSYLEAGKSVILPLDVFRPLSTSSDEEDPTSVSTSYEVILTYREARVGGDSEDPDQTGNQVMVIQRGKLNWIKPFTGNFSIVEGNQQLFPCGVQHESNMSNIGVTASSRTEKQSDDIISADGEQVRMRFTLKTNGLGSSVAAKVHTIKNEVRW